MENILSSRVVAVIVELCLCVVGTVLLINFKGMQKSIEKQWSKIDKLTEDLQELKNEFYELLGEHSRISHAKRRKK